VGGVRPGATLAATEARLPHGRVFHVGKNFWYLTRDARVTAIFKVRRDVVEEVGIADRSVTGSTRADKPFLHSFS
jgi:hypothetical protein